MSQTTQTFFVLLVASALFGLGLGQTPCDAGWITPNASDTSLGCFLFDTSAAFMSWQDAVVHCNLRRVTATLAEIRSQQIQDFLANQAIAIGGSNGSFFGAKLVGPPNGTTLLLADNWWIGAQDINTEGQFFWIGSGDSVANFTSWAPGEPNNGAPAGNEDCVHLFGYYQYDWNDEECDQGNRRPLCMYFPQ